MNDQLAKLVENDLSVFSLDYFSVIIGVNPSKGARSPLLWNKVYKRERKNIQMIPLDVRPENIKAVFELLECNPKCLGGAIAVPYKETVFKFIEDQLPENIKQIGAINCFYRQKKDSKNKFTGTNTDGEAALDPVYNIINDRPITVAVLGFGGAGKAILSFLIEHSHKENNFYLFNRTKPSKVSSNIEFKLLNADNLGEKIQSVDLLINTTSVGSSLSKKQSPVPVELICKIKKSAIVYDIIYDPKYTELLERANKLGLKIINGLRMNMIQAVLAYEYTNDTALSKKDILQIMSE